MPFTAKESGWEIMTRDPTDNDLSDDGHYFFTKAKCPPDRVAV
jgi:hypothetical protein